MFDSLFDFRREAIDRALDVLKAEAQKKLPGILRDPNMFPTNRVAFEGLLRTTYFASLDKNEGRSLRFSLVFVPPDRLPTEPLVVFKDPVEVTKSNLVALAPVAERNFGLGVTESGDRYFVWGIVLKPIPSLSIKVVEPGSLLVRLDFENAAVVVGDEFVLAGVGAAHAVRIIAHAFDAVSEPHQVALAALLVQVADAMRRHGNGGTVLIVPSSSDAWRAGVRVRRPLVSFNALGEKLRDYVRQLESALPNSEAWTPTGTTQPSWFALLLVRDLHEYLVGNYSSVPSDVQRMVAAVAQLTAVDGATVVNDNLEALGFSAILDAVPPDERVAEWQASRVIGGRDPVDTTTNDLGGTRHRSAARFVSAHRDCVALVVSHDGPVSFIVWDRKREKTLVFRGFELFLDRYW